MQPPCRFMNAQQWICYLYSLIQQIEVSNIWQGSFATPVSLETAFPIGEKAWFSFVESTNSFWYWSSSLNKWVDQNITADDYALLTPNDKASVPYLIVP